MPEKLDPILFYSGNFACKKMVESALSEPDYHLMSSNSLQDLPDLKALGYFHLIIFCPGNNIEAEMQYLEEVKRFQPGLALPLILLDPNLVFDDVEGFEEMDLQDYRTNDVSPKAIRFSVNKQLKARKEYIEQSEEIKRLKLEGNKKTNLLEEVSLKAQESDRLKTAFLNNISHELRTPMNGILGFLEYLEDPQLEGDIKTQFIKNIRVSSERLLNTLQDLIEISEIEAGDLKVKFETVNLRSLIDFSAKLFKPRAQAKDLDIKFELHIPEDKQVIWSDPNKLKGILIHLLNNAIKFTNKGHIKVEVKLIGDELLFLVSDTGIGMSEKDIANIYQHFVQIEEHLTRKYDGLGLGLSICEAYSRCLSGQLDINSSLDSGTTVSLKIPYISGKKERKKENELMESRYHFKEAKVLLVDDDPINLQLLEKFLRDSVAQLTTVKAKNGVEAIEYYRQDPSFDMVLMDLKMPLMNGFEATKIIRELNKEIPIIAQTAYAMHQDKEKALNEGCNDYLSKPLNKMLFYKTLDKYLKAAKDA